MREIIPRTWTGASTSVTKRYVDARGAVWALTIPDSGALTADSIAYRASHQSADTLDALLTAIEAYAKSNSRIAHSYDDTGASDEGKVTDADGSDWQAFYYKQQSTLEPSGQSGYYAYRYGALVGPSYVGLKDLTSLVNRYLDRVNLGKGDVGSLSDFATSASKIDDMPPASENNAPETINKSSIAISVAKLGLVIGAFYLAFWSGKRI